MKACVRYEDNQTIKISLTTLANVTPVFKNGQRNLPNNYRPISLTSQTTV